MDRKLVTAARRAVEAAREAHEAAQADDSTPTSVKGQLERVLLESSAVLEAAESTRRRQSFAEFTSLLSEELQEAAEESMSEAGIIPWGVLTLDTRAYISYYWLVACIRIYKCTNII